MLQNDSVRNLQYDSEIRIAQRNNAEPRVYDGPISITSQPNTPERIPLPLPVSTVGNNLSTSRTFSIPMTGYDFLTDLPSVHIEQTFEVDDAPTLTFYDGPISITSQPNTPERIPLPLPVSTVGNNLSTSRTFSIPMTGYDFLTDLPSVHIEQTFELNAALTSVSSENRYVVRSPLGDAVYAASESSTSKSRLLWGSARPFQMHLLDKTHQEALLFRKQFALGSLCCHPKNLEVWVPPGNLLGRIVHSPTFLKPVYYIQDGVTGEPIFCIEGPENSGFCCFCLSKESFFRIHSGGDLRASIDHKWLASKSQYTTNIYFSDTKLSAKERALILGAAFLLEYMYFQTRF